MWSILASKLNVLVGKGCREGGREVRRTKSFTSPVEGGEEVERPMTPQEIPTHLRKRHKPLIVKKVSVAELQDKQTTSGYLERKSLSAQWIKYWYVLHEGTLFCYLTPDDTVTVDVLNLHGYSVVSMVDKFRGKRFVVQLSHENFTSLYLSMDSRDEMDLWLDCLQKALTQPSSTVWDAVGVVNETETNTASEATKTEDVEEKRKLVKQKLLEEMLRQKYELERKQAERHRKQRSKETDSPDRSPSSPLPPEFTSDEQRTSDVTRLRQRRMSTQLKYETIQKQMKPVGTKRGLFGFGKAKKTEETKNEYLQDQLKELHTKLHKIDNDLTQVEQQDKLSDGYDVNQNRKSLSSTLPADMFSQKFLENSDDSDIQKNGGTKFKSTMQKWTNKTFNKSSTKKKGVTEPILKPNLSVPNLGARMNGEGMVNGHNHSYDSDSYTEEYHSLESSHSSVTDLTRPLSDLKLDLHIAHAQPVLNGSPRYSRSNSRGSTISNLSSPRREIDPSVMAEIEAFEQLTKQVLGARSKELPGK